MSEDQCKILRKEKFFQGNRQKWTGILLVYGLVFSILQIKYGLDPTPYINFAMTIGSLFILGGSVDSYLKINTASKAQSNKTTPSDT